MKNKNGFTLVEVLVSFSLASIVMILLLNIILILRDLYIEDGMKTNMLITQSNFSKKLEDIVEHFEVTEVNRCGNQCIVFKNASGQNKTFSYHASDHTFTIDQYKVELVEGAKVGDFVIENRTITGMGTSHNDSILHVKIPITHNLIDGDYGVNLVYPYLSANVIVNVT